jgi:ABC-2 type transport system ATP-binding protein
MEREIVIRARQLTRRFGALVAVDHLDLEVRRGEIFGLLGPNGSGKSTTIKMLTTLLPPSEGTAEVDGCDVVRQAAHVRHRIGYVPQALSADGGLTADENLQLSAKLYGLPRRVRRERIAEVLRRLGLQGSADRLVSTFSGGMIRRLELAQAMLHRPAVLFLDEPTVGLDPVARHAVWDHLREMRRDFDLTVLLTTHDMDEADALCDRLAMLRAGTIAVCDTPAALKAAVGPEATLDDVFERFGGGSIVEGGNYQGVRAARRTAIRLG